MSSQLSERVIFGSGFFNYSWWRELERVGGWKDTAEGEAPDGWMYRVKAIHPQLDDSSVTTHVSHSVLMGVMGAIYNFKLPWGVKVSPETFAAVKEFLMEPETATAFDAASADEVMQIAAYGKRVF